MTEPLKTTDIGIDIQDDRAALAAVAAGRAALGDIFLPPPGDNTVAAIACSHFYFNTIYKHGRRKLMLIYHLRCSRGDRNQSFGGLSKGYKPIDNCKE